MAQTLTEDCSYDLIGDENSDRRHVYFVKLTDSCLKAIEEFIIHKASAKSQPKIKFDGQNGHLHGESFSNPLTANDCICGHNSENPNAEVISIPGKPSSSSDGGGKKFLFGVSSLTQGKSQGAIECLKHPERKSNRLVSYGSLESKISINATEDVYENTRNRMAQVDAERKDVRTREIELKTTKKRKHLTKSKILTPESTSHKHTNLSSVKKKLTQHSSPSSHSSQPVSSTSRNSPAPSGKSFTCRERVIHILAVRPYKKPELISRMNREAMSQKNRNNLAMVLQQVSSIHDNQHRLHSHLYNEIQVETWPFYSEQERTTVKKNVVQHKKSEKLASQQQEKQPEKHDSQPEKHTSPPQQVSSTSKSPDEKLKAETKTSTKRPLSSTIDNHTDHVIKRTKPTYEEAHSTVSSTKSNKEDISPTKKHTVHPPVTTQSKSQKEGEESPPTVASTSKTPEYLKNYKPIEWKEQRRQYKLDFESEYPVYLSLKESLDAVRIKFRDLQDEYYKTKAGTPEKMEIEKKIREAYLRQVNDEKYHEQRKQYEELEQKLKYIKKLVVEYDNSMMASCE